ncbi:nucleotide exchange factor GrpE [Spirulina sp. CS-785/01]|uniref:nucleotide exchange factor GrpE n=1 Tax=Spirulina sp. CS-785/01 TaxID=3021716 RepID=UPI00233079F5|nr:nucleotide exchange factor GrpE [Spirulina sp. CS-785/01]MDB9312546.1 nucleotide exchange factor GrpE [Spirulina sp. CS-785/01]
MSTNRLRQLMAQAEIQSFAELSRVAGVSRWQVRQVRQGNIGQMRVENVAKIAHALQLSLSEFLREFTETENSPQGEVTELQQECHRLSQQLQTQQDTLLEQFHQSSLQVLETWLLQWPTAVKATEKNPELPASRLIPLLSPVENLMKQWGVEKIASVGEECPYNPQEHELMEGTAQPGETVRVRYVGYRYQGKLLYRARVSPVSQE